MSRRNRTEIFMEILEKLKDRGSVGRAELSIETLTNPELFDQCIDAMEQESMIKRSYTFSKSGRQREILEATGNITNSELQVKAFADVISPTLKEMFNVWASRHTSSPESRASPEELAKDVGKKRAFNLVRRMFKSEESKE